MIWDQTRKMTEEIAAILELIVRNQKNFVGDKNSTAIMESLATFFWEGKQIQD